MELLEQTQFPPGINKVFLILIIVAEEAKPRLSKNINMNPAGFYKDDEDVRASIS